MKKFDFAVQSITFITAIGSLLISIFDSAFLGYLALVQLFLGGWQLLSFIISLTGIIHADNRIKRRYINYSIAVVFYFLIWFLNSFVHVDNDIALLYIFGPPWIIALYYYYTCNLKLKIQKEREHSFLDLN